MWCCWYQANLLEGPKDELDLTENTQPAIYLVSYSIFQVIKKETSFDINAAKYFAGHSLGEYSALSCAQVLTFSQTIQLLKKRGQAMQSAVPKGQGGMLAVLGTEIGKINEILNTNKEKFKCYVANDNSIGQVVVSGNNQDLNQFSLELKNNRIKNIKLQVSAPFHCRLMESATKIIVSCFSKINRRTCRKLFVCSNFVVKIDRDEMFRLLRKLSKSELSSRFFGRLKIFVGRVVA